MKKGILKYIIPSVTLLTGVGIAIAGINMGAKQDYINQLNVTNVDSVVDASDVTSFNFNINYADIEISASNDVDDFEISAENIARNYLKYSISDNVLNLEYSNNKWYEIINVPRLLKSKSKITITVPAKVRLNDIQLKNTMGDISVNYITAENVYIDCGKGNSKINTMNADFIEIDNDFGNMDSESISCNEFSLLGGSGSNDLINFHAKQAKISTKTGKVSLSGKIDGDSKISAGMGDIIAEIYGDKKNYSIVSPDDEIILDGHKFTGTTKGKHKMHISTGLGDIKIDFK